MTTITDYQLSHLIDLEAQVHCNELPPAGQTPFVLVERGLPGLLSAPNGAITYRNNGKEIWHEEDEFTAGIALLLGEVCGASVIATTWKTADSDPNEHDEEKSPYKQIMRQFIQRRKPRW